MRRGNRAVTGSELAFLVVGLGLGIAAGVVLASVRRTKPRASGEVRVTVTTDAIPRRSATLASEGMADAPAPARGGPADAAAPNAPPAADRTPVRPADVPVPTLTPSRVATTGGGLVAVPMGSGVDPQLDALRRPGTRVGTALLDRAGAGDSPSSTTAAVDRPRAEGAAPGSGAPSPGEGSSPAPSASASAVAGPAPAPTPSAVPAEAPSGPCAELRVAADERCEVATRARQEATRAQETLRAAQRSYDDHHAQAEAAAQAADPRAVRSAKDAAQEAFRAARAQAATADAVDTAARDWLIEVNRINNAARSAGADANRAQEAARALAVSLDRLTVEADAARIAAEAADEACLVARQAAADCDESAVAAPAAPIPRVHSGAPPSPWLEEVPGDVDGSPALRAGTAPTIFRLLQGDAETMAAVVERLAGDDPDQRRAWQLSLSNLLDAILGTAIEGAALEFPEDHSFWGPFSVAQSRDIVAALGSLGYRYDGIGGWQDGRVPSQRDLSLALSYAGEDPMRVRHWPTETEMATLFESVRVAAGEYLAVAAGDLTLGELVTMLGPRADGLTDIWNAWGRVRPILLEER